MRGRRVVGVLIVGLALTSGLLWLLAPGPLLPDASRRLFAEETAPRTLEGLETGAVADIDPAYRVIFDTGAGITKDRWSQIAIFPSGTAGGGTRAVARAAEARSGTSPTAHFVICNGKGGADGEIQVTRAWDEQISTDGTIGICLIGTGQTRTAGQQQRVEELVRALRIGLGIEAGAVAGR